MSYNQVRRLLFLVHMWVGLVLGVLLALLGVSGSAIVYDDEIANFFNPPPQAAAQGRILSLDAIAQVARGAAGGGPVQISLPVTAGRAVLTRVGQSFPQAGNAQGSARRHGGMRGPRRRYEGMAQAPQQNGARPGAPGGGPGRGTQVFIDPVSGTVLGTRIGGGLPPVLAFAHQLHANFLMGRDGRTYLVGWLGVAMCVLGLTGLILWWPRRGQRKYGFFVRRSAKGLRFHRELHGAAGIWIFIVFMAVSFSGVVLAWPQAMGAPGFDPRAATPEIEPGGRTPITAEAALDLAQQALPAATPRSIALPARSGRPVSVSFLSNGAVNASVLIDPYAAKAMTVRDPSSSFLAWQRPVHQGQLGPVWRFLVFLSGFAPLLFVVTGIVMWWKKYRIRMPMNAPLTEGSGA